MTRDEALAWLATLFDEPKGAINPDTVRENIAGWDSLGVLTLMAEMDEKFEIQLSENDIENMTTVGSILDILERHQKLAV
jgi:acyl carrier protein